MSRHDPVAALHAHRYAFEGTVLERVLLTIIKAHPLAGQYGQDYDRLRVAMAELTGHGYAPDCDADMNAALDWMARERQRNLCDHDMKALSGFDRTPVPTVRELAILAACEFLDEADIVDVHTSAELLTVAFKQRRHSTHCLGHGAEREALENEAVERICAELAEWDMPTRR